MSNPENVKIVINNEQLDFDSQCELLATFADLLLNCIPCFRPQLFGGLPKVFVSSVFKRLLILTF